MKNNPVVVCAPPTPFDSGGALDHDAFRWLLAYITPHVTSVFVGGTTGEFVALTDQERLSLFRVGLEMLGPGRVIAHVGHASAYQTLRLGDAALDMGVTQFAAISPYYFGYSESEVVKYFENISTHLRRNTFLAYLFPDRTGVEMSASAIRDVLQIDSVAGVKLSGRSTQHVTSAVSAAGLKCVYSGDDGKVVEIMAQGGDGVVSGRSAAYPGQFSRLLSGLRLPEDSPARAAIMSSFHDVVGSLDGSVQSIKQVLAQKSEFLWAARI